MNYKRKRNRMKIQSSQASLEKEIENKKMEDIKDGIRKLLWTTTLDFGKEFSVGKSPEEFVGYVNQAIQLHGTKTVDQFRIFLNPIDQFSSDAEKWIEFAISRGVKELDLDFCEGAVDPNEPNEGRKPFRLPNCLYTCESLTRLSLGNCELIPPFNFDNFKSLETLCLRQINLTNPMLKQLLSNCSVLQNLTLWECCEMEEFKVSGPNLQLKILKLLDCWGSWITEIYAPKLQSFHYYGDMFSGCNFENISSLEDVVLSSMGRLDGEPEHDWAEFLTTFSHVKILTVGATAVQFIHESATCEFRSELLPIPFNNLQELQVLQNYQINIFSIIYDFFKYCPCPCLEKLFIQFPTFPEDPSRIDNWPVPMEDPSECIFYHLKAIKINNFWGQKNEMRLVKFFLEKAIVLESLVLIAPENGIEDIKIDSTSQSESFELKLSNFSQQILLFPKSSSDARIVLCEFSEEDNSLCPTHTEFYCTVDIWE